MDQDNMSNLYRGSSIDASYQVSVHLAEEFQRRKSLNKIFGNSTTKQSKLSVDTLTHTPSRHRVE
jgi:hypothetical protein